MIKKIFYSLIVIIGIFIIWIGIAIFPFFTVEKLPRDFPSVSNLPEEIRIGAILRDGEVIIPSSSYVFQKDDTVLLLSKRDQLPIVENMFRISSI